jgi:excisionase family DNA binding protein
MVERAWMTRREVMQLTGLSKRTLSRLCAVGILKPLHPTGTRAVRFRRRDVERWLETGRGK